MSRSEFQTRTGVSRETMDRLDLFAALLGKWTAKINLIAPSTVPEIWTRHFLDSAQLLSLPEQSPNHWVDIGSGGGLPGMVVAIIAREKWPDMHVTCIESDQRKAVFLRTVASQLKLEATVLAQRIEQADPQSADIVSARALAPLPELLGLLERHLAPTGMGLVPKGRGYRDELAEARTKWSFDLTLHRSETNPDGAILEIGNLTRV